MYITINSEFKPFTYDELTKPLNDYTEAYNKVEEQYATLAQQTEAWKNIATQENSPEAYAMYKKYSDELNDVVEDFSKGMTIQNRSKLSGLKSRYASEITPIANAYKAMQEANAYRDTVRAKDPNAIFTISRYDSIDHFLNNEADNSYISGKDVETSIMGDVLSSAYSKYTELTQAGVKPDEAIAMISSGQALAPEALIYNELSSRGYDNFDDEGKRQLSNAVSSGVIKGLGTFADKQVMDAAQRDASARGWANLEESKKQHSIDLEMHGYNKDGSINPNSPYWSMQGIKWTSSKDGTLIPTVGTKPGTKGGDSNDTKRGFITTERRSFNLNGEIKGSGDSVDLEGSTQVNYSDLNTEEKSIVDKQIGEDGDVSAFEFYVIRDVWRDANKRVIIVPKKSIILNNNDKGDNDL